MNNQINNKLHQIKTFIGLDLNLCDYFNGIKIHNDKRYFNIIINQSVSESSMYDKLMGLIKYEIISKVEPNGYKRLALYF